VNDAADGSLHFDQNGMNHLNHMKLYRSWSSAKGEYFTWRLEVKKRKQGC
jgi:hypothetical protein